MAFHTRRMAAPAHEAGASPARRNRATLAVARKLVAYLLAVDKSGQPFQLRPPACIVPAAQQAS